MVLKKFIVIFVYTCVILLVGIYARFTGLAWHFTHLDDIGVAHHILDQHITKSDNIFAVPQIWTYSPFQFIFTHFLISPELNYRKLLFWGRLPSCIFSILGLFCMLWLFKLLNKEITWKAILATSILACSWENIIFAKQMHNYALGVTANIGVLILFIYNLNTPSLFKSLLSGIILGLLCYMQYSILFFVIPFYIALLIYQLKNQHPKHALGNFIGSFVIFLSVVYPLWQFFLRKHAIGRGQIEGWFRGLDNQMFFYNIKEGTPWLDGLIYSLKFFFGNFFLIFQNNISFVPQSNLLFIPISFIFFILFIVGCISLVKTKDIYMRYLGIFSILVTFVWIGLIVTQKLTLSPTRHSLILLPLMAIILAQGLEFLLTLIKFQNKGLIYGSTILFIIIVFLFNYPTFLKERKDPFTEDEIIKNIELYHVDAVLTGLWTTQLGLMKDLQNYFNYYSLGLTSYELIADNNPPYKRIAFISHREPLSLSTYEKAREGVNKFLTASAFMRLKLGKTPLPPLNYSYKAYRIIYQKELASDVEIEFGKKTKDGSNNFYFYILERQN